MARMRGPSSRTQFWFDGLVLSGQTVGSGLLEQGSRLVNLVKKKGCESGRVASVWGDGQVLFSQTVGLSYEQCDFENLACFPRWGDSWFGVVILGIIGLVINPCKSCVVWLLVKVSWPIFDLIIGGGIV